MFVSIIDCFSTFLQSSEVLPAILLQLCNTEAISAGMPTSSFYEV